MRIIRVMFIVLLLLAAVSVAAGAETTGEKSDEREPPQGRFLLIPLNNPLKEFDANTMAWHTTTELLTSGGDALVGWLGWNRSLPGRMFHCLLTNYFVYAANHYSHEIAHASFNKTKQRFWLNLSDWSRGIPGYVGHDFVDAWDMDEYHYYMSHPHDLYFWTYIRKWYITREQAGITQQNLNGMFTARIAAMDGRMTWTDGVSFTRNQFYDFLYIARWGNEPLEIVNTVYGTAVNSNDVTGYIEGMDRLGIEISKDTWLVSSGLAALSSGQVWNSAWAIYRYIFHEEEWVKNIEIRLGERLHIAPPNFYLFSSVRGLYLDSETFFRGFPREGDGFFLSIGTGLDSFGLERTGPVDRVRLGGKYHGIATPLPVEFLPFLYLDFTRSFRQVGYSVGAVVNIHTYNRFFLTAEFEISRNDMIEQVIKDMDDGFHLITGLGFEM